jgi:hypothetical protein
MAKEPHSSYQKEPIALLWIIIGLLGVVAVCIILERLSYHY